ncbi:DUF4905 domain-containing protein [Prosthecochloris sp. SCSIO W1103]|uniref:DUF4905 domain-containing protein n=1 Tax=Prosthecochloris sp. SCSIO W1103 TaxID=2992244 RepID=UPI00223D80C8|nr:DUF4905 domain-containing protein [Prosthecochloris sp. SCSIO W1103]UZJ37066.1 DUF4905 domain-containing protein [Prosthecochloris sp. SCSIO W1103]
MPEQSVPLWRYLPSGNARLWRIMFLEPDLLVCENRLQEVGKTSFTCLSLASGKEILKDFSLSDHVQGMIGESCMTGLETARGNLFYIHGYQDNSPEHKGIWAVDPRKADVVWARPEAAFVANLEDGMLVYAAGSFAGFPERSYFLLDFKSGEVLETIGDDAAKANKMRMGALSDEALQKVELPVMQNPGGTGAGSLVEGFYESIEHDRLLVTVTHSPAEDGKTFDATIEAFRDSIKVYEDTLASRTTVPSVNYFLLRGVILYYIRGMNELISVRLQ